MKIILPLMLVFLSFIFWKFEERTRMLIKNGEEALKLLEKDVVDSGFSSLALFHSDERKTKSDHEYFILCKIFSYSFLFRLVYSFIGFGSIFGSGFMLVLIAVKS